MASDQDRRVLYEVLQRELGHGPATTMMELLPPVGWAEVARQSDLVAVRGEMAQLRGGLTGEMAQLRADMTQLGAELRGEMAGLRTELKGDMAGLRSDMADLRTELKGDMADLRIEVKAEIGELRAEVKAQVPRLYMANIGMAFATAGLVLAAAKLA